MRWLAVAKPRTFLRRAPRYGESEVAWSWLRVCHFADCALAEAAPPLSEILKSVKLDPLTVADDDKFLSLMTQQPNVPGPVKNGLSGLY